ncbi:MAG TPA: ATP-binding protein [Longimicrobiaceae bacterium]|nr:ATP-binding protein [Longimicrobiaceae bacterium]
MSLRLRVLLTLLAITAILLVPALYAATKLSELNTIARTLRTRDAEASLALGRLQSALGQAQRASRVYAAVYYDAPADQKQDMDTELNRAMGSVERQLSVLEEAGYADVVRSTRRTWRDVRAKMLHTRELALNGRKQEASDYSEQTVESALDGVEPQLDRISAALNDGSSRRVQEAQDAAEKGATGTLAALGVALAVSLLIGLLLTRSVLRPIHELQRGMAAVAEGDLEPEVRIARDRSDELGDLVRSFDGMTKQLAELDRLKAEFVSVASHEIKTPLSVIRGYVSLLIDGIYGPLQETQTRTLQAVSDQTDRLARLVHRLLDVSRFEAGGGRLELRTVDVRDFLEDLATGFQVLAMQNDIGFHVVMAADLPATIDADPERLNEVVGNLLSNAFKFTPKKGSITLASRRDGDGVEIEVADTGVGIPSDKLPKIFEKFFQVENDAQPRSVGSGLGLAIAREIVEAHGGTIGAESEVGTGTRFRLTLPARPPQGRGHSHPT